MSMGLALHQLPRVSRAQIPRYVHSGWATMLLTEARAIQNPEQMHEWTPIRRQARPPSAKQTLDRKSWPYAFSPEKVTLTVATDSTAINQFTVDKPLKSLMIKIHKFKTSLQLLTNLDAERPDIRARDV